MPSAMAWDRSTLPTITTRSIKAGVAQPMNDAAPAIPGYALLRLLGRGENSQVWLAHDPQRTVVAIKLIHPGGDSPALNASLRQEQLLLAQLDHPHIARLHCGGDHAPGQPFLVMDHVDGPDLHGWLAAPRPLAKRLALLRQIAQALHHAHRRNIVHRDLTGSNVLVDQHGAARVIDFGRARQQADVAGDVYALGKIMAALLAQGSRRELSAIAARASAGRPQDRYGDMAQLLADLDHYAACRPVPAYSTKVSYRLGKWFSRHRIWLGTIVVVALAVTLLPMPS
jgi:serine/threonine protein kinase